MIVLFFSSLFFWFYLFVCLIVFFYCLFVLFCLFVCLFGFFFLHLDNPFLISSPVDTMCSSCIFITLVHDDMVVGF